MTNQKGITLVSLIITIIVMLILAGVGTVASIDSIKTSQRTALITQLEMVESKVNTIYEKRKLNQADMAYYDTIGQDVSELNQEEVRTILGDVSPEGFRYFSKEDLRILDLDNMTQDVLINYDTRAVYSYHGIEVDDAIYYRLQDIPSYTGRNIEYIDKNNQAPTFSASYIKEGDGWRFTITDIVYTSNVKGGTVSHKFHTKTNWILDGETTSFKVTTPGLYDIRLTDKAGNSTIIQKFVNYDYITDGLIAYYDGENNTGDGHSSTATTWKDLSKSSNDNDAILTNFENNETSGWQEKSLQFNRKTEELRIPISLEKASTFSLDIVIKEGKEYINEGWIIASNVWWNAFGFHTWMEDGSIYIGGNSTAGGENDRFIPDEINYKTTPNKIDLLTYTYNGETKQATVYANGEKVAQKTFTADPEAIEYFYTTNSQLAYSRISLYNKVLTEDEVKQNYEIDEYRFGITKET